MVWIEEFRLLIYHCSHYHLSGALSMILLKKTFFIFCLTLSPQSTVNITVFCLQNKYFSPHFPPSDAKILSYVSCFYSTKYLCWLSHRNSLWRIETTRRLAMGVYSSLFFHFQKGKIMDFSFGKRHFSTLHLVSYYIYYYIMLYITIYTHDDCWTKMS